MLYFIFALDLGNRATYQLALCGNVLMLVCVYVLAYKLIQKMAEKLHVVLHVLIALVSVLYTGVLFFSQYTMSEMLICLLFWIILYNIYCLLEKYSRVRIIAVTFLLVYCFFVHQRLLGLVVVGGAALIYILIKNKKTKDLLWILPVFAIIFVLMLVVKLQYKSEYLSFSDLKMVANEFQGQTQKLSRMLSMDGVIMFVIGVLGKLFYACSGTFMLFFVFVVALMKELVDCIKQKQVTRRLEIWMFVFLVCMATIAISVVFLLDFTSRFDLLIYGRYFDFSLSPILVFSLVGLMQKDEKFKIETWMFVVYFALTFIVSKNMPYDESKDIAYFMCPALSSVLFEYNYNIGAVALQTLLIACFIKMMLERKKQTLVTKSVPIVVAIVMWVGCFISQYNVQSLYFMPDFTRSDEQLAEHIREIDAGDDLYFYTEKDKEYICFLQFVLREYRIHIITDENEVYNLKDEDYILTIKETELFDALPGVNYEEEAASDSVIMWRRAE